MIEKLSGQKTYLALIAFAIVHILVAVGILEEATGKLLEPVLACGAVAALRHGVSKAEVPSD